MGHLVSPPHAQVVLVNDFLVEVANYSGSCMHNRLIGSHMRAPEAWPDDGEVVGLYDYCPRILNLDK